MKTIETLISWTSNEYSDTPKMVRIELTDAELTKIELCKKLIKLHDLEQYQSAQTDYAYQEIQKLIDAEFGEDNIKEVQRLDKMFADELESISHIPTKKKLQNKADKLNLRAHYLIRSEIRAAQNELYRIKEPIEQKYETPEYRSKFMTEFLNVQIEELY